MIQIKIDKKKFKKRILFTNVNITIPDNNEIILITGESGTGKTTLINMLKGVDNKYKGQITVDGKVVSGLTKDISIVNQDYNLYNNLTVYENLKIINNDQKLINKLLKDFKINSLSVNKVNTLSGGEKQRVAIIRAILLNTKYIIMDEPTSALDNDNFDNFMEIINEINKYAQVIIVTHDVRLIKKGYTNYNVYDRNIKLINQENKLEDDSKNDKYNDSKKKNYRKR